MDLYMIRRREAWKSPEELGRPRSARSRSPMTIPEDIAWIRSYVIEEADGTLGTLCIYQASSEDAVRSHADGSACRPTRCADRRHRDRAA